MAVCVIVWCGHILLTYRSLVLILLEITVPMIYNTLGTLNISHLPPSGWSVTNIATREYLNHITLCWLLETIDPIIDFRFRFYAKFWARQHSIPYGLREYIFLYKLESNRGSATQIWTWVCPKNPGSTQRNPRPKVDHWSQKLGPEWELYGPGLLPGPKKQTWVPLPGGREG